MKNFLIFVLVASLMGHSQALHLLRKRQVTVSPCTTGTCVNGGVCHTFGNVATCSCLPGYGGLFCELVINPNVTNPSISTAAPIPSLSNLCLPNPCLNGELMRSLAVICENHITLFVYLFVPGGLCAQIATNLAMCICQKNFQGVNCGIYNGTATASTGAATLAPATTVTVPSNLATALSPLSICFTGACLNGKPDIFKFILQ